MAALQARLQQDLDRLLYGDVRLKVWVPESVHQALTLLADDADIPRPALIRHIFVAHVFGRTCLEAALIEQANRPLILFSLAPCDDDPPLPLGKRTVDAVILVASEVRDGLKRLAQLAGMPIGTYACYVLCWATFGYGVYATAALQATVGYWLDDDEDKPESRDPQP